MANEKQISSTLPPVHLVAAHLHDAKVRQNKNSGVFSVKLTGGEETMVPYDELSDAARVTVTATVDQVYAAVDAVAAEEEQDGKKKK